jgi:hypothetical protein
VPSKHILACACPNSLWFADFLLTVALTTTTSMTAVRRGQHCQFSLLTLKVEWQQKLAGLEIFGENMVALPLQILQSSTSDQPEISP